MEDDDLLDGINDFGVFLDEEDVDLDLDYSPGPSFAVTAEGEKEALIQEQDEFCHSHVVDVEQETDALGPLSNDRALLNTSVGDAGDTPGKPAVERKIGPNDFELLKVIGMGAFGKVLMVRSRRNDNIYAMKCIGKKMLYKRNHVSYMKAERDIMARVEHPFIVSLKCAFQTESKLFLVMEYLPGGELFYHLSKKGLMLEADAVFYTAEMVLALEHLHSMGIVHRDLKPENLLLRADGHICLTDFGLAKELDTDEEEGLKTICGTNEYLAPEMILRRGYGKAVDWWSLGALAYEMMTGYPPFRGKDTKELNRRILNDKVSMPKWLSSSAHTLMRGLLERDSARRLGATRGTMFEVGGVSALKAHPFFGAVNWDSLLACATPPPFQPSLAGGATDTSNFCEEFVAMRLPKSFSEDSISSMTSANGRGGAGVSTPLKANRNDREDSETTSSQGKAIPVPGGSANGYLAPNGLFRGFSFVADKFFTEAMEKGTDAVDAADLKELPTGFLVGPSVLLANDGEEDMLASGAKSKTKGKRIRKKKQGTEAADDVVVPALQVPLSPPKSIRQRMEDEMKEGKERSTLRPTNSIARLLEQEETQQAAAAKVIDIGNNSVPEPAASSSSKSVWKTGASPPRPARVPQPNMAIHPSTKRSGGSGNSAFPKQEVAEPPRRVGWGAPPSTTPTPVNTRESTATSSPQPSIQTSAAAIPNANPQGPPAGSWAAKLATKPKIVAAPPPASQPKAVVREVEAKPVEPVEEFPTLGSWKTVAKGKPKGPPPRR